MTVSTTAARYGRSLIAWFASNPVAANLLMVLIVGAGLASAFSIEKQTLPEFETDTVTILVPFPGAGPSEVEQGVVLKVEEAIADTLGIEKINSVSREGSAEIRVTVVQSYDVDEVLDEIKRKVDAIPSLPRDSERPIISKLETRIQVMWLSLYGTQDRRQLQAAAEGARDDLLAMPEIEEVRVVGEPTQEISIEVDEQAIRQYGLTFSELAAAISGSSTDIAAGVMRTPEANITIRSIGQAYDREDFGGIVVKTAPDGTRLLLSDIATVRDGFEDNRIFARYNGQPSLNLRIMSSKHASDTDISRRVQAYIAEVGPELPAGLELQHWADNSVYLQGRLNMMLGNLALGAVLVYFFLSLFIRLRVATWVVIGIPISFLGALWLMPLDAFGVSINVISLFAFILVLGVVVDDAIIIGESVDREISERGPGLDSVIRGTRAVALPSTLGVLTSIAAFAPMAMVQGQLRPFFATVSITVVLCLLFSLVESKLILPAHLASSFLSRPDNREKGWFARKQDALQSRLHAFVAQRYRPLLRRAIDRPGPVLAGAGAVFLVTAGLMGSGAVRYEFFPNVPSDLMRASFTTYQSAPVGLRDSVLQRLEDVAWSLNDKFAQPGGGADIVTSLLAFTSSDNSGQVVVELSGQDAMSLVEEWREAVGPLVGVKELQFEGSTNTGGGSPIDFRLSGADLDGLEAAAADMVAVLKRFDGVYDVRSSSSYGKKEIRLSLKPMAENLGLSLSDIGRQVRQAFYGEEVQRIQRGRDELKVWLRYPRYRRESLSELENMWISTGGGRAPLSEVADIEFGTGHGEIGRINRAPSISIRADIDRARVESRHIIAELRERVVPDILRQHPSVSFHLDGASESQAESLASIGSAALFALFLIYTLMAVPLRSYGKPLLIMSVVPFGFIGAVLGHVLMGKALSMMSLLGIVALSGVVVNDSLILVNAACRYRDEGQGPVEAAINAGAKRFRAVVLTSLTTFVGLLPIILETSVQAQFVIPMAISLGFGVVFATVITLLLIPLLIVLSERVYSGLK
jgi:multidrug efflux pump subunit AcrB